MKLQKVSASCYTVINEKNRVCDANSGLINLGGGVLIDTQSDLPHARRMIELFSTVWTGMPKYVINTHEDSDHVWGNQLFKGAEIIAHRSVPERMRQVANPHETQKLVATSHKPIAHLVLKAMHPGVLAIANQLEEDYSFNDIELVMPTTLFDDRHVLSLDGVEAHIIYVGPCHQVGDTIVHLPSEGVVFAGDVLFCECTPIGWTGTYANWIRALDLIIDLNPKVVVPGHGPVCGVEGVKEMKEYLEFVRKESRVYFDQDLSAMDACSRINLGSYAKWHAPGRLYANVERAYREFRGEPANAPWDSIKTFDAVYKVAKHKGLTLEF